MHKSNLEKKAHYYILYRFYGKLLTDKQQQYFQNYFFGDLSLNEVAIMFNISRNAIHDSLVKTMKALDEYEEKLNLYQKYQARKKIYNQHQEMEFVINLEEIDKI